MITELKIAMPTVIETNRNRDKTKYTAWFFINVS